MSGETEERPSGWTVDTIREYFEARLRDKETRDQQRFEAQEKALIAALEAADKLVHQSLESAQTAVDKQERASALRFESVNEFRAQLSDQVGTFVRRDYLDAQLDGIDRRIADIGVARQAALDEARTLTNGLLPREVYEAALAASLADRAAIKERINAVESEVKAARRASAAWIAAVGMILTVLLALTQLLRGFPAAGG